MRAACSISASIAPSRRPKPMAARIGAWMFAALVVGCATPPERLEREQALRAAIAPCLQRYPSVKLTAIDDYGRVYARAPEHDDVGGFEQCAQGEIKRAGLFRI